MPWKWFSRHIRGPPAYRTIASALENRSSWNRLPYVEFLLLQSDATAVITDSSAMQAGVAFRAKRNQVLL
jgi:UDP-N-acetylglucosamine 2-epimerase